MFASIVVLLVSIWFANCSAEKTLCKIDNECSINCKSDDTLDIERLKSCRAINLKLVKIDANLWPKLKQYPMGKMILVNNNNILWNISCLFQGTNITNLYLHGNNITELKTCTFAGNEPLTNLALNNNNIKDLQEKSIPIVENLFLQDNLIESLNAQMFVNISRVKLMKLENNLIKKMTAASLMGLKANELKLSFNRIEYLEDKSIPEVKNVYIDNNKLVSIEFRMFVNISKIIILDVSYNSITAIPNFNFSNINLYILNISNNKITYLSQNTFSGIKMLKDLILSNNLIEYLENNSLPRVDNLNLSNNFITFIDAKMFVNINNKDISYNCIQSIDFNLKGLNVSNQKDNETCSILNQTIKVATSNAKLAVFLMFTLLAIVCISANAIRLYSKRLTKTAVHLKTEETARRNLSNGNNNSENIYEEINEPNESVEHLKENDLYDVTK